MKKKTKILPIREHRCQAVGYDGRQCRNHAFMQVNYHGDGFEKAAISWVMRVWVCKKHYNFPNEPHGNK